MPHGGSRCESRCWGAWLPVVMCRLTASPEMWSSGATTRRRTADRSFPRITFPCNPPTVSGELLTDGEYLVSLSSGGFSSVTHYFDPETQEHLATRYSTDVNVYCNDFSYWYGRRLIPRLGGSVDIVPLESAP